MLILVRHPPVDLPAGICYGRLDVDIARMSDIDAICGKIPEGCRFALWSSPSLRCARVAAAIEQLSGAKCRYDPRLRELDFGLWEGTPWSEISRSELDRWAADPCGFAAPEGERGCDLISRVTAVYENMQTQDLPQVVVSHGGPLRILSALARRVAINLLDPPPPPGSVVSFA